MKNQKIIKKVLSRMGFSNPSQYTTPKKFTKEELLAAIRQDIIAEYDAVNLYTAHSMATDDLEIKKVLEHIISEEKEHAVELEKILYKLDPEQKEKSMEITAMAHSPEINEMLIDFENERNPQKLISKLKTYFKENRLNQNDKFKILHTLNPKRIIPLNLIDQFYSLFY